MAFPLSICVFVLLAQAAASSAAAQEVASCEQRDLDSDGRVDVAVILSSFFSTLDTILVYDEDGDMPLSSNWRQATDYDNDVWIFDAASDGSADLIIDFGSEGNRLTAELWDDQDGDGRVSWTARDRRPFVEITESAYATVRVVSRDGWWASGGRISHNLEIETDGPVLGLNQSLNYSDKLRTDGHIDLSLTVYDLDTDGVPDLEVRQATPPVPESWGIYRTHLIVSTSPEDKEEIAGSTFWPYLGGVAYGVVLGYDSRPPPIQMDWSRSRLAWIGEFVPSHGSEHDYFITSILRFDSSSDLADFENPFAFYDLADDHDGVPELQIRSQYFGPHDRYYLGGLRDGAYENIRYSWDQDNDRTWDYKVDLVGRHVMDSAVAFPGFSVYTVPYERYPYWVTQQEWDVAVFVAWEAGKAWTSEGIYEWGASAEMQYAYIPGISEEAPYQDYMSIHEGFRGEYGFDYGSRPRLYISSLDHRLHLYGAEAGVWHIDEDSRLLSANVDSDPYLDQWLYFKSGELQRQLSWASGYLVYGGEGQVLVKEVDASPALFETVPPRGTEEWEILGGKLDQAGGEFGAGDLRGIAAQFQGSEWRVEGGRVSEFRHEGPGFRFVLELTPGFSERGSRLLELEGTAPGRYVVSYDGAFHVVPLEPAKLRLAVQPAAGTLLSPVSPATLLVRATNEGLEDARDLLLVGMADSTELTRQRIDVLAGDTVQVEVAWQALEAGDASLAFWLESGQGEPVSQRETITLTADPAGAPNMAEVLGMSRPGLVFPLEGLFLGLLSLTVWLAWKLADNGHPT